MWIKSQIKTVEHCDPKRLFPVNLRIVLGLGSFYARKCDPRNSLELLNVVTSNLTRIQRADRQSRCW